MLDANGPVVIPVAATVVGLAARTVGERRPPACGGTWSLPSSAAGVGGMRAITHGIASATAAAS